MARLKKTSIPSMGTEASSGSPSTADIHQQLVEVKMFPTSLPQGLETMSGLIHEKEYVLATEDGDEVLSGKALEVVKGMFDLGLSLEKSSHPHLHTLLAQILSPPAMSTRSSTKAAETNQAKRGRKKSSESAPAHAQPTKPTALLPYTPLDTLHTEGMDSKQIWQQLELRASMLGDVLRGIGIGLGNDDADEENEDGSMRKETDRAIRARQRSMGIPVEGESEEDEEGEDDDESLDLDDPDLTPEEKEMWEKLLRERPEMFSEREEGSDHEDELDTDSGSGSGSDEEDEDEEDEGGSGDGLYSDEEGDEEMMHGFDGMEDDDESDDELANDDEDINMDNTASDSDPDEDDLDETVPARRGPTHPTLDDQFFSIDEFNALTEEAEAGKMSSGSLGSKVKSTLKPQKKGKDGEKAVQEEEEEETEDEMDEGADLAALLASGDILESGPGGGGEADMMYSDFFAPPPKQWTKENPNKAKPSGKDTKAKPEKNGRGKAAERAADVDMDAETALVSADVRTTMHRVRNDLFDDEDEDAAKDGKADLSSHQKRQLALQEQIAALEQENVGQKDWVLMGEVKARDRPENGLLEEELDFEHTGKVVPLITEERVMSLEEIIKKRILDDNFDDVVRRREIDDKAFLPSRYFELQDTQASKSLAQIYEDEYTAGATGSKTVDPRDAKLQKDHEEIDKLWGEISYKLDALSNLNFTPKQPKAAITTISNVATTTLESALPTTQSTSTMLAPEEMFAPPSSSALVARSELDSGEKRRARQKSRKQKMHERQALDAAVDKFSGKGGGGGKARGGVKAQKDRALEELVKSGKGVTVVGKDTVRKRGPRPEASPSAPSSTLKL